MFGAAPGVSVACLAVVAIVISFRATANNFKGPEQTIWIILSVVFLCAEISFIKADRVETDARERRNRAEEREKFESIIEQGKTINRQQSANLIEQRSKFSALFKQGERSIGDLKDVAKRVDETTSVASGGNSFPEIFPGLVTTDDGLRRMGFYLHKHGKYPLFDLEITVGRPFLTTVQNHVMSIPGALCRYGEINDNTTFPLMATALNHESAAYFTANMTARNGAWDEVVDVRRVGDTFKSRWVIYQAEEYSGPHLKAILDLADAGFPIEHRHDLLHPVSSLEIPDGSLKKSRGTDVVFRPQECKASETIAGTVTIGQHE